MRESVTSIVRRPNSAPVEFAPKAVINGILEILAGAKITLRGLHRGVAKQQLDLLERATGSAAELGAGAAQVVGRKPAESGDPGLMQNE